MSNGKQKSDRYPPTIGKLARLILESHTVGEPIILSINGKGKLAVVGPDSIQQLYELVDHLETLENLRASIREVNEGGKTYSLEEVCQELKARHGV